MDHLGNMIKQLRKENGLTQKELAKMVHVSQQAIARYESQKAEPTFDVLVDISEAFGVPIHYFLDMDASEAEQEYIAIYRSLNEENQRKALDFLRLLRRQENEFNATLRDLLDK
ncbi:helix-turn-helix domain-containing protein [Enterococcus sp. DIV0187]|uniref:helix-turn-helix domain-containing protein n=1 Tax=Enterococcus sp. DIV0187 TaxID=2774644 RepID=UPI003F230A18